MDEKEAKRWDDRIKERRLWEAIGKRIREARQNKELTVEELSGLVDLVPQTLYRIEVGVSGTTITKLRRPRPRHCRTLHGRQRIHPTPTRRARLALDTRAIAKAHRVPRLHHPREGGRKLISQ